MLVDCVIWTLISFSFPPCPQCSLANNHTGLCFHAHLNKYTCSCIRFVPQTAVLRACSHYGRPLSVRTTLWCALQLLRSNPVGPRQLSSSANVASHALIQVWNDWKHPCVTLSSFHTHLVHRHISRQKSLVIPWLFVLNWDSRWITIWIIMDSKHFSPDSFVVVTVSIWLFLFRFVLVAVLFARQLLCAFKCQRHFDAYQRFFSCF